MKRRGGWEALFWLLLGSPLLFLIIAAVVALVATSDSASVRASAGSEATLSAIAISLRTTLLATLVVAVFGTCLAMAIVRSPKRASGWLEMLVTLPAFLPPSVAGLALLLAFGRFGLLGSALETLNLTVAFTPIAVVLAQVFVSTPFYVREASAAFAAVDPVVLDAARMDGAGGVQLLKSVMLPVAAPFLWTGVVLAWTRALGEFGATMLFAGNLKGVTQTMPLAIYLGFETDIDEAKALAVILLAVAVLTLAAVRLLLGRRMSFAH